jgi:hypothetical protein
MYTGNIGFTPYSDINIVKDNNVLQAVTSPGDLLVRQRWNIHVRPISIQNSSRTPVRVVINNVIDDYTVDARSFMLAGLEIKNVAVNSQGGMPQYIHLLDFKTNLPVSKPCIIERTANAFVLRDGLNMWFVQRFHYTPDRASH